jgi:hypothetical protein
VTGRAPSQSEEVAVQDDEQKIFRKERRVQDRKRWAVEF